MPQRMNSHGDPSMFLQTLNQIFEGEIGFLGDPCAKVIFGLGRL